MKPTDTIGFLNAADFRLNPLADESGYTQSEMQLHDDCGEKWYLRYNMMLSRKGGFSWALIYGNWMHAFWEEFYSTGGKRAHLDPILPSNITLHTTEDMEAYEYWSAVARIQSEIYASYYKNDCKIYRPIKEGIERVVQYRWEGVLLTGKLDMECEVKTLNNSYHIMDHKTTARLDRSIVLGWDFRLQFMFYAWLAWKTRKLPGGVIVNAMKKPQLQRGVRETLAKFIERVSQHMRADPEKYLYRDRLVVRKRALERFEKETLWPKVFRIKMLRDPHVPEEFKIASARNKNTLACTRYGVCEFLPVCTRGLEIEKYNYKNRPTKHEELAEEGEI